MPSATHSSSRIRRTPMSFPFVASLVAQAIKALSYVMVVHGITPLFETATVLLPPVEAVASALDA